MLRALLILIVGAAVGAGSVLTVQQMGSAPHGPTDADVAHELLRQYLANRGLVGGDDPYGATCRAREYPELTWDCEIGPEADGTVSSVVDLFDRFVATARDGRITFRHTGSYRRGDRSG